MSMKVRLGFLNRFFWVGFVTGSILTPVILLLIILIGAAIFNNQIMAANARNLPEPPLPEAGGADYDWTLHDVNGNATSLADFKDQPVLLTLWDARCSHCLAQLPALQGLYEKVGQNVAFVPVVISNHDSVDSVVEEYGVTFPVYLERDVNAIPAAYQGPKVPRSYILSSDGDIHAKFIRAHNWNTDRVHKYLRELNTADPSAGVGGS